jgi:hypothetical protein
VQTLFNGGFEKTADLEINHRKIHDVLVFLSCSVTVKVLLDWHSSFLLRLKPGLPDGRFSYQKSQFRYTLEAIGMVYVGIIYSHLIYFRANRYTLWSFGKIFPVWYVVQKNMATLIETRK